MRTLLIVSLLSSFFLSTMAWPKWRGRCTSDQDCPASHPDCSVEGFCTCANDQPCWDERGGGGSPATTYPASPSPHPPSYNTLEAPSQGYSAPKAPQASPPTDSYQEPSLGHIKQPEEIGYLQPSPPQSFSPTPAAPPAAPPAPTPGPAPSLAGSCKSDQDCPASHPICSEWYFCQCPSYKPGGVGCWDPEAVGSEGYPTPPPPPAPTAPATPPAQGYPSRPPTSTTSPAPLQQKNEDHYGSPLQISQHGYHPAEPVQGYPIPPPPSPQAAAPAMKEGVCSSDADCSSESPICSEFGFCQCPSYQPGGEGCWDLEAPTPPENLSPPPPPPAPASAPVEEKYEDHYGYPAVPSYRGPLQTPL